MRMLLLNILLPYGYSFVVRCCVFYYCMVIRSLSDVGKKMQKKESILSGGRLLVNLELESIVGKWLFFLN